MFKTQFAGFTNVFFIKHQITYDLSPHFCLTWPSGTSFPIVVSTSSEYICLDFICDKSPFYEKYKSGNMNGNIVGVYL